MPSATVLALFELYVGVPFIEFCDRCSGSLGPTLAKFSFPPPTPEYPPLTDAERLLLIDAFDAEMIRRGRPTRAFRF